MCNRGIDPEIKKQVKRQQHEAEAHAPIGDFIAMPKSPACGEASL